MTPDGLIASLDRALDKAGTPATLTRKVNGAVATAPVRIKHLTLDGKEIVGGVAAPGAVIVISPTDLRKAAATWPGTLAATDGLDPILPRKNDAITVTGEGRIRILADVKPIYVAGVLVRINITMN